MGSTIPTTELTMIRTIYIFLAAILIEFTTGQDGPVVQTQNGLVRGRINATVWNSVNYSSFRGIPFAQPPVGNLRFQPPVPADSWDGTWDATRHRNVCIQVTSISNSLIGDEDCLYINVYSPYTNFTGSLSKKAVLFWIYGGDFSEGSGNDDVFGPDYFIEQDCVVVTFNYRLGAFGFLALQNSSNATGNQALKDQNLALQWVNKNIAAFGGDPTKILIFGQSAGASSVGFHVLSKRAEGLFSSALQMSGSPLCVWAYHPPSYAHIVSLEAAALVGYVGLGDADSVVNYLLTVPATKLAETTTELTYLGFSSFTPTIEDAALDYNDTAYITNCPISLYQSGNFTKVPNVMGHTNSEFAAFLVVFKIIFGNTTLSSILPSSDPLTKAIISALDNVINSVTTTLVQVLTDLAFSSPIDLTQKLMNSQNDGKPIYYYLEAYRSPYPLNEIEYNITYQGVAHDDDIQYVWYRQNIPVVKDPNDPYHQFQLKMVTMYANFAKYGNPTPENDSPIGINWTPSGSQGYQLNISNYLNTYNSSFEIVGRQLSALGLTFETLYSTLLPVASECTS